MVVATLLACGGGGGDGGITNPPPPGGGGGGGSANTVILGASSFSPTSLTIQVGGTVTWNNTSATTHNVTFNTAAGAPPNIGDHSSGSSSRTFTTAGTFGYQCTLHGGMTASITVQ
ncbi:MAG TPA: plastocyanin/azurin family copper-binding protein [Gemmatimonadaceae bacterium]|nr:plastocyanin/azurin family copper-binding protein [Gemmatimonadaceae bacterium]